MRHRTATHAATDDCHLCVDAGHGSDRVQHVASYDLRGRVALVTGAARGIGFATARALVGRGASVVIVDLDASAVERAADELDASRAPGLAGDATAPTALPRP